MKKRLVSMILLAVVAAAAACAGCSKKEPAVETPAQTETVTKESTSATQETTIEPFAPSTEESETMDLETDDAETTDSETTEADTTKPEQKSPAKTGRNNRLIIATDIHYLAGELTDGKDAFIYMVEHGDGKLANYVWEIVDAFVDEVIEEKPQALILSGDLSLNGEKKSHEELAAKLKKIEAAGIPVVVIPGNHDINNPAAAAFKAGDHYPAEQTTPEDFEKIYHDFGYGEALSRDSHSLSYTYQLDDYNRLLMLDSCQYDSGVALVGGMIKTETYEWMDDELEAAWDEGINIIPVSHHNLMDESQVYVDDCTIEHSEDLQRKLSDWNIPWYLSGHLHVQHYKSSETYGIDEVVTASLSTAPCQYGMIEYWDDGSFTYQTRAVDVPAWAKEKGIQDKNLLNFPDYSKKMLEKVFYNKVMDTYKYSKIPRREREQMAKLYGKLNSWSYAGRAVEIVDEVTKDPAYKLWEEYGFDSVLYQYMEEIVRDAVRDYNTFKRE